jgi:uncharacterized membrane protein
MQIKNRHVLYAIDIFTILLAVIIFFFPDNVLRIVLGLPLVLFFPGYTLISALFPRRASLDRLEKIALSFGISIAIVPLIGLILNYTPWGIQLYPILISMAIFILCLSLVAWLRQVRMPEAEKPAMTISLRPLSRIGQTRTDRALSVVLGIVILAAIATLVFVVTQPRIGEKFTEFYILGQNGKADNYPTQLNLGDSGNVIVGIINREQQTMDYRVEIKIDGVSQAMLGPITLTNDSKSEMKVTFTPNKVGDNQEVEFLLYKNGQDQFSEELHLWANVSNPS